MTVKKMQNSLQNTPSKHTKPQQCRYNVAATSRRYSDVVKALCVCWDSRECFALLNAPQFTIILRSSVYSMA